MGIEGVGPKIIALAVLYLVIAYSLDKKYPSTFTITNDTGKFIWLIFILATIGIALWLSTAVMLLMYFPKGKLITTGPFKLFLNPLYNAFALFILPTLTLYLNSWVYLGASLVFLIAQATIGKAEERYLSETLAKEYENYRKQVIFKF